MLAGALVIIIIAGALVLTGALDTRKIAEGVSVSGLPLGGMRRAQATAAIRQAFDPATHDIVLTGPGSELCLSQAQTGAALNLRALLDDAFAIEAGSVVELSLAPYLSMDEEGLYRTIGEQSEQLDGTYCLPSFTLEGDIPPLGEDQWNPQAAMPTLAVTLGTPGYTMDANAAVELIFAGLSNGKFEIDLSDAVTAQEPPAPDAQEILQEVSILPVNAQMDPATKTVTPGSYGLGYDEKKLAALLEDAADGQTVRVTLEPTAPEVMGQEAYFQDVLGFCQTPHGSNEKRNANLTLACQALNGVVLQPGQTLSYNETLGQRTKEAGYQEAPAYSGTTLVDSLGGGICQVSSTLYLASVYAEMTIVDRRNHGYPVSYIPLGMDATVSWGFTDLKIRNDSPLPVKIHAEESDGYVRVSILGTETRDYDIEMSYTVGGRSVRTYMSKIDKKTGELISKEPYALSGYIDDIY